MITGKQKIITAFLPALFVFIADLASKYLVQAMLMPSDKPLEVTNFFNIVAWWNKGVSFSLFANGGDYTKYILALVSLIIIAVILFWIKKETSRFTVFTLGVILGGACANLADRLYNGAVFDFLDFHIAGHHWPAFNIADSAIVCGTVMLIISCLKANGAEDKKDN